MENHVRQTRKGTRYIEERHLHKTFVYSQHDVWFSSVMTDWQVFFKSSDLFSIYLQQFYRFVFYNECPELLFNINPSIWRWLLGNVLIEEEKSSGKWLEESPLTLFLHLKNYFRFNKNVMIFWRVQQNTNKEGYVSELELIKGILNILKRTGSRKKDWLAYMFSMSKQEN